jgi:hypothetical protein
VNNNQNKLMNGIFSSKYSIKPHPPIKFQNISLFHILRRHLIHTNRQKLDTPILFGTDYIENHSNDKINVGLKP